MQSGQYSIAQSLLEHRANVDALDSASWPLLLRYIVTQRLTAARFLIEAGASVDSLNPEGDSALHLAADMVPEEKEAQQDNIVSIVELLLSKRLNVNLQNRVGDSALHRAIRARNMAIFTCLLRQQPKIKLELENDAHETPLWLALQMIDNEEDEEGGKQENNENCYYFAQLLLDCPAVSLDWAHPVTGDSLLSGLVRAGKEKAALFLVEHGANVNTVNRCGESALHLGKFLLKLFSLILLTHALFSYFYGFPQLGFCFTAKECQLQSVDTAATNRADF